MAENNIHSLHTFEQVRQASGHLVRGIADSCAAQLQESQLLEALLDLPDAKRARQILASAGTLLDLAAMGPIEHRCLGISWQESARMMVLLEMMKRIVRRPPFRRVHSTTDLAADLCLRCQGLSETRFGLLGFNPAMEVLVDRPLSIRESCDTHPRAADVYRETARVGVSGIVVWHNHLSGDPRPTEEDVRWTDEVRMVGDVLHVSLVDHIIVGDHCYNSLRVGMDWHP